MGVLRFALHLCALSRCATCARAARRRRLVPTVKGGAVPRVPALAQPWRGEVPVGAYLARHRAQVLTQVLEGGTPPEPVAVVDAVDDQAGLENERVGDHRVVLRVGVLLDVELLLRGAAGVRQEGPVGAERRAELFE